MSKARVKLCPKCSGIKKKKLVEAGIPKDEIATGCIGACLKKHPELAGMAYVKVNGKLIATDSKKKLAKKATAQL